MRIQTLDWQQTIPIRHHVLWPNKEPEFCIVEGDKDATHFGAFVEEKLVCVASLYFNNNTARLRKFATLPDYQGKGIGSFMLKFLVSELKTIGATQLWFDARESALGFYQRHGFEPFGERFYKGDVPYFKMRADL